MSRLRVGLAMFVVYRAWIISFGPVDSAVLQRLTALSVDLLGIFCLSSYLDGLPPCKLYYLASCLRTSFSQNNVSKPGRWNRRGAQAIKWRYD
jgi:hypothetical protein